MIGQLLCWLGFHRADPACTYIQKVHWPDDGVSQKVRRFEECIRCRHPWSKEVILKL